MSRARLRGFAAAVAIAGLLASTFGGCLEDEPNFGAKEYPPGPIAGPPGRFHPSAIRAYWYFNEPYGERREIHFIATGPRRTHIAQARRCVEYHLEEEDIAAPFCKAYPTERAFEAARFTPSNGQIFKNCWSARAEKPANNPISADVIDRGAIGEEGCPDLPR